METDGVKLLFEPRGVAVVGASHSVDKIGYKVLENIVKGGYAGGVYPVNPNGGEILGKRVFKTANEHIGYGRPIQILKQY